MIRLGRTDLWVTKNGFGALPVQRIGTDAAIYLLKKAYNGGINYFDTARMYTDSEEKQIIVRFPWQSQEEDYDPTKAVEELGTSAVLTFIEGTEYDESKIILKGNDVTDKTTLPRHA